MVPVLSSSSVDTSPAASTARPDMASTLRCTSRSMPAMPIAESSAPIVVGIRQTSSATSTIIVCCGARVVANGGRVTTASRKTIVSEASRMFSAISLGVFCRAAPSTRLIIRSMKVSPGFVVILMTIRSERTFVPPVTADRSPPDSRMTGRRLTGDRRLVDGRHALDDVTVAGDDVAGLADDQVADAQLGAGHLLLGRPPASRRATVSVLALRRVSACALPRPSATASARLAKIDGQPQPGA